MYKVESLGLQEAKAVIEAMIEEAMKEPRQPVAMAVVDNRGALICYARMDGANAFNDLMATRKASTAALIGVDTAVFREALPSLNMNLNDFGSGANITTVPGGVCVNKPGGGILGGIGVSGRLAQEDDRLARVGLKALNLK
ncbi:MAG: hypothetical protein A2Y91_04215 [Chloroflexi bacterium RBG_13_54_8]|nr:MAG: hypothetical protein A2Y91_04215 [Chloroflexi bacterium RBG_13_54_8]